MLAVEKLKNQSSKSMRARGRKFGVKTRPQIFLAQNLIFFNGSMAFRFPRNPRKYSTTVFRFLQRLSAFFNGFPIFLNGFPLSKKSGKIYLWRQVYERSLSELRISAKIAIFCDKIISGKNTKDHYPTFVFFTPSFVILAN